MVRSENWLRMLFFGFCPAPCVRIDVESFHLADETIFIRERVVEGHVLKFEDLLGMVEGDNMAIKALGMIKYPDVGYQDRWFGGIGGDLVCPPSSSPVC